MSVIDTIKHQRLGTLAKFPLYWPQESASLCDLVTSLNNNSLDGSRTRLVGPHLAFLGGGSGEHPALVIHINEAIECFLQELVHWPSFLSSHYKGLEKQFLDYALFKARLEELDEHIQVDPGHFVGAPHLYRLDLNNWPLQSWMRLHAQFEASAFARCLDQICHYCLEEKLLVYVGLVLSTLHVQNQPGLFKSILHPKLKDALDCVGPSILLFVNCLFGTDALFKEESLQP